MKELNRIGSQEKCPACGSRLDADAYRCPKCMIYFCFKCRRRVAARDPQYQCLNQQCKYYGKLLCEVCTTAVPEYKTHTVEIPDDHHTKVKDVVIMLILGCAIALGIVCWIFVAFSLGVACAIIAAWSGLAIAVQIFDGDLKTYTTKSEQYQSGIHRECIACNQPVEILHS